jgi:hypothetical protein
MLTINIYAHSNKETNYDTGQRFGLEGEALEAFMYAGYEEKLTYEVDPKTGRATLVMVNDRTLL